MSNKGLKLPFNQSVLIIPTYNEVENIAQMLELVNKMYPDLTILIIDDDSPDKTADIVKKYAISNEKINLIQRSYKNGLAEAYITGFNWALEKKFQYILQMDCDFSHNPEDINSLLYAAQSNDLVIGSRYINGIRITNWSIYRLILSYLAGVYTRIITGLDTSDVTSGFRCFTNNTLKSINLNNISAKGYSFQIELTYKISINKFKVKEIPITFTERKEGKSKMSGNIIIEGIFNVLSLRFKKILGVLN